MMPLNQRQSETLNCCGKGSVRKKEKENRLSDLPQELIYSILLRFPAQALHDVMRHVCREWNLLIRSQDFVYSHLRNSTGGLLFEDAIPPHSIVYVEMRGDRIDVSSAVDCGRVLSSCNGLILTRGPEGNMDTPFVLNPLTKQRTNLPPCYRMGQRWTYFAIAFVEASMEYKVVCSHEMDYYGRRTTEISVLTIGVDRAWRDICVDHLIPAKRATLMGSPHVVAGGFMHWVGSNFLLTLNVETEQFRQFPLPRSLRGFTHFRPMGSKLSGVDQSRKLSRYIWEMDPETGEWTMLHCIDLKPLRSIFYDRFRKEWIASWPSDWLVAGEVLVLEAAGNHGSRGCICIAYDVRTKGIRSFKVASSWMLMSVHPHVNSLVLA